MVNSAPPPILSNPPWTAAPPATVAFWLYQLAVPPVTVRLPEIVDAALPPSLTPPPDMVMLLPIVAPTAVVPIEPPKTSTPLWILIGLLGNWPIRFNVA